MGPRAPGLHCGRTNRSWRGSERVLRNAVIDHYRRSDATRRAVEAFARDPDEMVPPEDVQDAICASVTVLALEAE